MVGGMVGDRWIYTTPPRCRWPSVIIMLEPEKTWGAYSRCWLFTISYKTSTHLHDNRRIFRYRVTYPTKLSEHLFAIPKKLQFSYYVYKNKRIFFSEYHTEPLNSFIYICHEFLISTHRCESNYFTIDQDQLLNIFFISCYVLVITCFWGWFGKKSTRGF